MEIYPDLVHPMVSEHSLKRVAVDQISAQLTFLIQRTYREHGEKSSIYGRCAVLFAVGLMDTPRKMQRF